MSHYGNSHVPAQENLPHDYGHVNGTAGTHRGCFDYAFNQYADGFMVVLGVISLSGMIIRNSIILIDQIELHRKEGQTTYEAIVSSTILRFRPIMLTALAAILGMVPLMRSAFWSPMAIAFSGGLFVATILTLIVLPVMYAVYFKAEEK